MRKMKTVKITMKNGDIHFLKYKVEFIFESTTWIDFISDHDIEEIEKIEHI